MTLGVPDDQESLEGATSDNKIHKIWTILGVHHEIRSHRRHGNQSAQAGGGRKHPILVTVSTRNIPDEILEKARQMKSSGEKLQKIYIKKDVYPSVREEWSTRRRSSREGAA